MANVSITTASQALNRKGRVSADTRDRVIRAAKELGYVPNVQARALKTGQSLTLLVVLPGDVHNGLGLHSAYICDILTGAADQAIGQGYLLSIAGHASLSQNALLNQMRIGGALFIDPVEQDLLAKRFLLSGIPAVTIGRLSEQTDVGAVENDYDQAMETIFAHLQANGFQKPALLTTRAQVSYATDSIHAYERLSRLSGLDRPIVQYVKGYPSIDSGLQASRKLLRSKVRPDVVIATTEPLALGALQAFSEAGLQSPADIGLVSMSDSIRLASATTSVTALDLRPKLVGRTAVQVLIESIANPETARRQKVVATELFVRASTSAAGCAHTRQ
jgi:LacI family transcriptional regulator